MPTIISINTSPEKGTLKTPVPQAQITPTGIQGDAHSGNWHRQISLLAKETIDLFGKQANTTFKPGDFAENLTTQGLDLATVAIGDRLDIGTIELEVTQIGKKCHGGGCAVFRQVGRCVMPQEGIFTRVIHGGTLQPGDTITHHPRPLRTLIITLSDRASRGEYSDLSGPAIQQRLTQHFATTRWHLQTQNLILPDDPQTLHHALTQAIAQHTEIIITTGGTGIGPRDITPDTVAPLLHKTIPGIMEAIRVKHGTTHPNALLSRAIAGIAHQTLIYTLPGSPKATQEYLDTILPTLEHTLLMLRAIDTH